MMGEFITSNPELSAALVPIIFGLIGGILKRVIPGTKDDRAIVKTMDRMEKIATLGLSRYLPNQNGRLLKK